jgi:hypothetical protein
MVLFVQTLAAELEAEKSSRGSAMSKSNSATISLSEIEEGLRDAEALPGAGNKDGLQCSYGSQALILKARAGWRRPWRCNARA